MHVTGRLCVVVFLFCFTVQANAVERVKVIQDNPDTTLKDLVDACFASFPDRIGVCDARDVEPTMPTRGFVIPSGGTIILPVSQIQLETPLLPYTGSTIDGFPPADTFDVDAHRTGNSPEYHGTVLELVGAATGIRFVHIFDEPKGLHGFTIRNLRIDGSQMATNGKRGCLEIPGPISGPNILENLVLENCTGAGLSISENTVGTTAIRNVVAQNNGVYGFTFFNNGAAALHCDGCEAINNGLAGISFTGKNHNSLTLTNFIARSTINGRQPLAFHVSSMHAKTINWFGGHATCWDGGCRALVETTGGSEGRLFLNFLGVHTRDYPILVQDSFRQVTKHTSGHMIGRFFYP